MFVPPPWLTIPMHENGLNPDDTSATNITVNSDTAPTGTTTQSSTPSTEVAETSHGANASITTQQGNTAPAPLTPEQLLKSRRDILDLMAKIEAPLAKAALTFEGAVVSVKGEEDEDPGEGEEDKETFYQLLENPSEDQKTTRERLGKIFNSAQKALLAEETLTPEDIKRAETITNGNVASLTNALVPTLCALGDYKISDPNSKVILDAGACQTE